MDQREREKAVENGQTAREKAPEGCVLDLLYAVQSIKVSK
jgi:hypothetical protein